SGQAARMGGQDPLIGQAVPHGTLQLKNMAASSNSVRFGVNLTGPDRPYAELLATARVAEEAGFDALAFTDRPPENNFEAWTLATAIGVQTQRIRLTHNTLNVPFRNPAMLAKMANSLDSITGGDRLILT